MQIDILANALSEFFALEAAFGLVLFAVVITAIARGLLGERHRASIRPHARRHR
jgi:hypothetical protein